MRIVSCLVTPFFFNDTAPTEIYTLSLHDALPISSILGALMILTPAALGQTPTLTQKQASGFAKLALAGIQKERSEEHTSELQSHSDLVCRLLLEKKKKK